MTHEPFESRESFCVPDPGPVPEITGRDVATYCFSQEEREVSVVLDTEKLAVESALDDMAAIR